MAMKTCMFCGLSKPLTSFYKPRVTPDGHWYYCIDCEKKYKREQRERKEKGIKRHIVSFSGGKDSTAMLILLLEHKIPIDEILYFDCQEFEFPQMQNHIKLVEEKLNVRITKISTGKSFLYYLFDHPRGELGKGFSWPMPGLRWCTNFKINKIKQYLRKHRPYVQYIGYAFDEQKRAVKGSKANSRRNSFITNEYPLIQYGVTEKEALHVCKSHGFHWDGLYDVFDRVSCWCCPLQKEGDVLKLKKYFPELYSKLKMWNDKTRTRFKNDSEFFNRVENLI